VTEHRIGRGRAVYVGTRPEPDFRAALIRMLLDDAGIRAPLQVPAGVEVTRREDQRGAFLFVLNHTDQPAAVRLPEPVQDLLTGSRHQAGLLELQPRAVAILVAATARQT
jgi:beta-galactosidase